jgi:hypothetical protein
LSVRQLTTRYDEPLYRMGVCPTDEIVACFGNRQCINSEVGFIVAISTLDPIKQSVVI